MLKNKRTFLLLVMCFSLFNPFNLYATASLNDIKTESNSGQVETTDQTTGSNTDTSTTGGLLSFIDEISGGIGDTVDKAFNEGTRDTMKKTADFWAGITQKVVFVFLGSFAGIITIHSAFDGFILISHLIRAFAMSLAGGGKNNNSQGGMSASGNGGSSFGLNLVSDECKYALATCGLIDGASGAGGMSGGTASTGQSGDKKPNVFIVYGIARAKLIGSAFLVMMILLTPVLWEAVVIVGTFVVKLIVWVVYWFGGVAEGWLSSMFQSL